MTESSKSNGRGEVTELLRRWSVGETDSLDPLFNLVYPRLRRIASALFRGEPRESMLQPTGVVNELFIKLVRQHSLQFLSGHGVCRRRAPRRVLRHTQPASRAPSNC